MNAISFDLSSKSNGWSFTAERKSKSAFPSVAETALHNTAETFAADISRRIAGTAMPGSATAKTQDTAAQAGNSVYGVTTQDLKDLENALAGVINNIVEKFGVKAGNIAQALVYKKIGEDEIGFFVSRMTKAAGQEDGSHTRAAGSFQIGVVVAYHEGVGFGEPNVFHGGFQG